MLDPGYLTKHERGVLVAALANYRTQEHKRSIKSATAKVRGQAAANKYVAADLLRVLTMR